MSELADSPHKDFFSLAFSLNFGTQITLSEAILAKSEAEHSEGGPAYRFYRFWAHTFRKLYKGLFRLLAFSVWLPDSASASVQFVTTCKFDISIQEIFEAATLRGTEDRNSIVSETLEDIWPI